MMPLLAAMDAAIPASTPTPGNRPEPAAVGGMTARMGRLDRKAPPPGASFQDALRAAGAASRPESTEPTASSKPAPEASGPDRGPAPAAGAEGEGGVEAESDAGAAEGDRVDPAAIALAALGQALREAAVQPVVSEAAAAGAESADEGDGRSASELLDLLKEIQAAQGALGPGAETDPKLAQLIETLKTAAEAESPPTALPGQVHQLLRDLREHLSGIAWGQAVKDVAAEPQASGADTVPTESASPGSSVTDRAQAAPAAAGEIVPESGRPALPGDSAHPGLRGKPDSPRASVSEPGREASPESDSPGRSAPVSAGAVRAAESSRPAGSRQDASAPPETGAASGGASDADLSPITADTRAEVKPETGEGLPQAETPDAEPAIEPAPADLRLARVHDGRLERTLEGASQAAKDKDAAGATRAGVYDQIVQKAVLQVKNEQSEIKIDLKPEFLGNVRMQIVTENQQVSVRILTEVPAVRDMIETGLQQLRSELQNQGLQVDRLEVAVSEDYREPRPRQGKPGERSRDGRIASLDNTEGSGASDRMESVYFRQPSSARRSTVDMFV